MKLKFQKKTSFRIVNRLKRKVRIRRSLSGTAQRPRLTVYRSNKHFYGQLIDDVTGQTMASASSAKMDLQGKSGRDLAAAVGSALAGAAQDKKIKKVVFDRNGFIYHGRVKAFADAAREAGLEF